MAHARGDDLRLDLAARALISRTKFHRKTKQLLSRKLSKRIGTFKEICEMKHAMHAVEVLFCSVLQLKGQHTLHDDQSEEK